MLIKIKIINNIYLDAGILDNNKNKRTNYLYTKQYGCFVNHNDPKKPDATV